MTAGALLRFVSCSYRFAWIITQMNFTKTFNSFLKKQVNCVSTTFSSSSYCKMRHQAQIHYAHAAGGLLVTHITTSMNALNSHKIPP